MVLGFQHISIHPHKSHQNGIKRKAVLDDWQFSLLASRDEVRHFYAPISCLYLSGLRSVSSSPESSILILIIQPSP